MAYIYTIYTPNGAVVVTAHNHNQDQLHKFTLTDANYSIIGEFQTWHGYTRELAPAPLESGVLQAPVEPGLPPAPGDYTSGPITFPELPVDDDIPF